MAEPETKGKTSSTSSSSSIMPDWSQLPEELLYHISTHLEEESCFDVVHARSVCSLWRSAFPFPSSLLRQSKDFCTLEKVPLFLFRLRAPDADADADAAEYFLRGISRDESEEDHMELLPSPLQCSVKVNIPGSDSDPTSMNMLDCQILYLGHQYRMIGEEFNGLAFLPLDKEEGKRGEFVVLLAYSIALMVLTSAKMRWKQLKNVPDDYPSGIVTYRGKFYATFLSGEIFVIDPYSLETTLELPSPHQPPGSRNCLVPSGNDELFLVEVTFPTSGVLEFTRLACKVSRLDEEAGKWVEVSDLGDRVLIIGNASCSAKGLPHGCGLSGNSILFTNGPGNVVFSYKYEVHT